ncbi:hypothetical protein DSM104443_02907 [Usitatibacter rugosus]|uniref:Poly(Hydroxyalkanoate) depolymerase family esterase n=1 Tax=Usitatibacter rugosus TaxID=2732067 RepID=A0A6M4GZ68_9PROT|nr:PHB depolymerase family esterase [Usitatibacter rugosus]QJR11824.1 hypothetical protein DSM104443_02907 [Usitatibacter rugosus]
MIRRFIAFVRAFFARLFGRVERPGYFVKGSAAALLGQVVVAPFLPPSREYLVYVPRNYGGLKRHTLIVFIHGCKQTPEEFAAGTRIAALADTKGWIVLMPRQTERANRFGCWNWFDPQTSAGRGEAAIVLAQIKSVQRQFRVDKHHIVAAGFSSGGALAAALGIRHPRRFAGVFVHSGIACEAAHLPSSAYDVMARGARTDPAGIGRKARASSGAIRLPMLAVHGEDDEVVALINGEQVAEQFRALNGEGHQGEDLAPLVKVPKLAHAWSGGDGAYPFNDPKGPDATAMLGEFVERLRGN